MLYNHIHGTSLWPASLPQDGLLEKYRYSSIFRIRGYNPFLRFKIHCRVRRWGVTYHSFIYTLPNIHYDLLDVSPIRASFPWY
jgi:hypothetical protein